MNLLPKHQSEFSTEKFWENFFKLRGSKTFEWYGNYSTFCNYISHYIKLPDKILVIGCGNSELSASMYDVGYKNILNIDNNLSVIKKMSKKFQLSKPQLLFAQMDVTDLQIDANEYSVVLDKGTLDAIFSENTIDCCNYVNKMFIEIERILKFGGRYFCITLAQPYIAHYTLQYFYNIGWMIRVCRIPNNDNDESNSFHLPVFIFIFTKFKKMSENHHIIEISYFEDKIERLSNITDLLQVIDDIQKYSIIKDKLKNGHTFTEQLYFEIFDKANRIARYKIYLVDGNVKSKNKYAIFIVPQGRELEWMFITDEGRLALYDECGFQRLLVVTLNRAHNFKDLEQVKEELSSIVLDFAPLKVQKQCPFLTIGDTISVQDVVYRGSSSFSGEFVIEDVKIDDEMRRRLIFLNNPNLVQSEARLISVENNMEKKYICSRLQLPSSYQLAFVSAIAFCSNFNDILNSEMHLLLVGLGAGNLAMFLKDALDMVFIDCIEIDEEIIKIAKDFFGFECLNRINCLCGDGIQLIEELVNKNNLYDIIFIDVDNKNTFEGLSCPPQQFIQSCFLQNCLKILHNSGLLVFNVACRNKELYEIIILKLKSSFTNIYKMKFPKEMNEIVFCLKDEYTQLETINTHYSKNYNNFEQFKLMLDNRWNLLVSKMPLIIDNNIKTYNFNKLEMI